MNEELKIIISAEIDKLKKNVDNAKKTIKDFIKEGTKDFDKFNEEFQKAGDVSKKALGITATAIAGAATALLSLGPATAEYREAQAKLTTAFETAGGTAETAKETYNDLFRVLGDNDTAVEAANHLAKLTTNQEDLSEWTNICQGVYATFGDSLPIEGLTEAANETAKVGTVTGSLADALNWAGINEDAFNESLAACNTEAEREKLIRETLNGLYSDAASTYEENNAQILAQNEAQAKLNDSMAVLGEAIAPINTMLTELGAEILADLSPYIVDFAEKHLPDIKEALEGVGEKIGEVINWLADNWDLVTTIGGIILATAAAISVLSTVMTIVNAVMLASPVTWIVLGIVAGLAALSAIIIIVVKNWDEIKAAVSKAVENIKKKVSEMVDKVKQWFTKLKENTVKTVENIKSSISKKFNEIKTKIVDTTQNAVQNVKEKFNNMKQNISNSVENAKAAVSEKFNSIKQNISNACSNALNNAKEKFNSIKSNITNACSGAFNTVRDKFNSIKSSITEKMNAARDAVKNAINKIKGFFNFKWSLPKIKLPHFTIKGKFSLNPPSVPKFNVSWYKLGGVFDMPTLFGYGGNIGGLGEDGAEAIVPLEKNTKWLDRIATMLNEKMGGGSPIVLQVDGKTFAQISVDSINQLTRQRGSLPLKLV